MHAATPPQYDGDRTLMAHERTHERHTLDIEADAARYRWLVANSRTGFSSAPHWLAVVTLATTHADDSTLTEIIDRARAEGPQ